MKHSFLNLESARKVISSSKGRKPTLHWKILFSFGVGLLLIACGISGGIFWWATKIVSEGPSSSGEGRTFNKKQFEDVMDYFNRRKEAFDKVDSLTIPPDPA